MRRNIHLNHGLAAIVLALTLCLSLTAMVTACRSGDQDRRTIAFVGYNLKLDFFSEMDRGTGDAVRQLGYEYVSVDQQSDEVIMVTRIKELISRNVAALIISPVKPAALGPVVDLARAKGIPVIIDDIGGGGSNYNAIVISDNTQGGQLAARYMAGQLKDRSKSRKVAIIKCEPTAVYAIRRGDAFKTAIIEEGYQVVSEMSGYSRQEDAYTITKALLEAHPDLEAIFAENDPMAVGAVSAIVETRRSDILVVGFNGDQIARDSIKAGNMKATVVQDPYSMGQITAQLADKLIRNIPITFDDAVNREIFVPVRMLTSADLNLPSR